MNMLLFLTLCLVAFVAGTLLDTRELAVTFCLACLAFVSGMIINEPEDEEHGE